MSDVQAMSDDRSGRAGVAAAEQPRKPISPAAQRALAEAAARRAGQENAPSTPAELNGRGGLDPARYGDWEVKGIASDF